MVLDVQFLGPSYAPLAVAALIGAPVGFGAVAYFTRAGRRETASAAAAGLAGAVLNIVVDIAADGLDLWWYPVVTTPFAPLAYYLATAFIVAPSRYSPGAWRVASVLAPPSPSR